MSNRATRFTWIACIAGAALVWCGPPGAWIAQAWAETATLVSKEPLPVPHPVRFLERCLARYDLMGIGGYRLIMQKQERVDGRLGPVEEVEVHFRAQPYSVQMRWLHGARRAQSVLYVEGAHDGKLLVRPTGLVGRLVRVVALDPGSAQVRDSGRYSIKDFGLRNTLKRTLDSWKDARARDALEAEYMGVHRLAEAGGRPCYLLRETAKAGAPDDVAEAKIYIDTETGFQVGTVLRGRDQRLLGEYMYRNIELNPDFEPDRFERAALTKTGRE